MAALALDLDKIGALAGGPGQIDVATAEREIEVESRRVFERPFVKATSFEQRGDALGSARPADDAIERMPAMIEQDAAACQRWINAPVLAAVGGGGDRRLSAQSPPTDRSDSANRAFRDQR